MEAKVMMIKCQKNRKAFGARIQKEGRNWRMTWAFKIDERIAQKEKFSSESTIKGSFIFDEEYPGCPHCGAQSFYLWKMWQDNLLGWKRYCNLCMVWK